MTLATLKFFQLRYKQICLTRYTKLSEKDAHDSAMREDADE